MEIKLSPSILAADFWRLGDHISEVERAGAPYIHIDVMDGVFVPNLSFGLTVIESIRRHTDIVFDVHLMITRPERFIERFAAAGADIITFHAEATDMAGECIDLIRSCGKRAGIAISPGTDANAVMPYIDTADMILCMTVEPGYGGQKYMKEIEKKVSAIRSEAGEKLDIQVDGGITKDNIIRPVKAGANVIVAGTSVFSGDIQKNIKELTEKCEQL